MDKAKPFKITKMAVWEAYQHVRKNKGSHGIDWESIEKFEKDLKKNLYKIWNRLSSGSYFPPAVRMVEIPKSDGKKRVLGIPTVSDRIAQMVIKKLLEPTVEPCFHEDSYGYRPGKSAIDAVGKARERCWENNWVIDLDIKGFFDNINHELMLKAVRKHTKEKFILLYVERWLKAPIQMPDGTIVERTKGTPQGGVISPLLANLFLHYAFDAWMKRKYSDISFERYADDIVVHCRTEKQALWVRREIESRLKECFLEVHPEKTKIVYCKDVLRPHEYKNVGFDFLGFEFCARKAKNRWGKTKRFFTPAISKKASQRIRDTMRSWKAHRWIHLTIEEMAEAINPVVRGWINYYGRFYKSKLNQIAWMLNRILAKWVIRKYKKRRYWKYAFNWIHSVNKSKPELFAHWKAGFRLCMAG